MNTVAGVVSTPSAAVNRLNSPQDVFVDGYQNMFVVDTGNNRVILFTPGLILLHHHHLILQQ